jgi:hypothetical protein
VPTGFACRVWLNPEAGNVSISGLVRPHGDGAHPRVKGPGVRALVVEAIEHYILVGTRAACCLESEMVYNVGMG